MVKDSLKSLYGSVYELERSQTTRDEYSRTRNRVNIEIENTKKERRKRFTEDI